MLLRDKISGGFGKPISRIKANSKIWKYRGKTMIARFFKAKEHAALPESTFDYAMRRQAPAKIWHWASKMQIAATCISLTVAAIAIILVTPAKLGQYQMRLPPQLAGATAQNAIFWKPPADIAGAAASAAKAKIVGAPTKGNNAKREKGMQMRERPVFQQDTVSSEPHAQSFDPNGITLGEGITQAERALVGMICGKYGNLPKTSQVGLASLIAWTFMHKDTTDVGIPDWESMRLFGTTGARVTLNGMSGDTISYALTATGSDGNPQVLDVFEVKADTVFITPKDSIPGLEKDIIWAPRNAAPDEKDTIRTKTDSTEIKIQAKPDSTGIK